jgi:hypothetical protein
MNDGLIKIDILDLKVRELSKLCSCFSGCDIGCPFYNPDGKDGHAACHIAALLDVVIPKKKVEIDVEICDAGMFESLNNQDKKAECSNEVGVSKCSDEVGVSKEFLEHELDIMHKENHDLRKLVRILLEKVE